MRLRVRETSQYISALIIVKNTVRSGHFIPIGQSGSFIQKPGYNQPTYWTHFFRCSPRLPISEEAHKILFLFWKNCKGLEKAQLEEPGEEELLGLGD